MTAGIDIAAGQRKTLLALLRRYIPGAEVWAYGSRVRWNARPNSDLDLVAFTTPAQRQQVSELKEALGESNIPFLVDLHVWDDVPERFHAIIRKEYVVLQKAETKREGGSTAGNWGTMPLEDCMTAIIDYRGKSPTKTTFGIPLVTAKIIKGGRIKQPEEFIAEKDFDAWMQRGIPKPGDIVMTTEAPLGEVAQLDGRKVALAQRVITLRGKPEILDNTFLKFLLQSNPVQEELRSRGTGTTVTGIRQSELRKISLTLPPLPEQKAIAHILGTLDNKIELNRRMNATLEAMARALFQSWFVDFDPVRAKLDGRKPAGLDEATAKLFPAHFQDTGVTKIPVGWKYISVEELCSINAWSLNKNDALNMLEYVEISEVNRGNINNIATYQRGEEPSRARRRLRHGDTVLSTVRPDRGSYFLALNPPNNRVASTGFAVLTPKKVPWAFIHSALTQPDVSEHLGQLADGGAYPAVRPEIIGAWKVVVPHRMEILEAFQNVCEPLFTQAEANREQSRTLAVLRNTLLPKLLSGELSIAEASFKLGRSDETPKTA